MKTSVNMVRTMGNFEVVQRTKDGMFNATTLLKQWNKESGMKKEMGHFFSISATKEFMDVMQKETIRNSQVSDNQDSRNSELPDSQIVSKSNAKTDKNGLKTAGAVWMHPYLFIDFAMWINPRFKYQVIKFVHDQLIEYRHEAGNKYKVLSSASTRLGGVNYGRVAKALNWIVFGKHESGTLRQTATKEQLNELAEVQSKLAFAIDMGYITTFQDLINEMEKLYHKKYKNFKAN